VLQAAARDKQSGRYIPFRAGKSTPQQKTAMMLIMMIMNEFP